MDTHSAQIGGRNTRFSLHSCDKKTVELLSKAICKPCEVKLIRLSEQDILQFSGAAIKQTIKRKRQSKRGTFFIQSKQRREKNRIYQRNLTLLHKLSSGNATVAQVPIHEGKQEDISNLSTSPMANISVEPIREKSNEMTVVSSITENSTPKPLTTHPTNIKRRSSKTAEDRLNPVLKKPRGVKSSADDTTVNIVVDSETDKSKYFLAGTRRPQLKDQQLKQNDQDKSNISKNLRVSLIKLEDLGSSPTLGMKKTKIQNGHTPKRRRVATVQRNTLLNYFHLPDSKPLERKEPTLRRSNTLDKRLLKKYKLFKEPKIILERVDALHNAVKNNRIQDKQSENSKSDLSNDEVGFSDSFKGATNDILETVEVDSPLRSSPILGKKLAKHRPLVSRKDVISTAVTSTTNVDSSGESLSENFTTNTKDNMEEIPEAIENDVEASNDSLATCKMMSSSTVQQDEGTTTSLVESQDTTAERSSSPILIRSPRKQYSPTLRNTSVSPRKKLMERSASPRTNKLSIGPRIQVLDRLNDTSNINPVTDNPENQVSTQDANLSQKSIDVTPPRSPKLLGDKTSAVPRTITPIPSRSRPILARRAISTVRRSQTPTVSRHRTPTPPRSRNQTPTLSTSLTSQEGSPINSVNENCDSSSTTKFSICLPSRVPVTSPKKTAVCSPRRTLFLPSEEEPACSSKHAVDSEVSNKESSIDVERKQYPKGKQTLSTLPARDSTITINEKEASEITTGDAISTEITPSATNQLRLNATELTSMSRTTSEAGVVNSTAMSEDLLTERSTSTICKNATAKTTKIGGTSLVTERSETKSLQDEDQSKSTNLPETYKCIVCDVLFSSYSLLQEHLRLHTQKKNSMAGILSKDPSPIIHKTSDLSTIQTFQATGMPQSSTCEGPVSADLSSENNEKNRAPDPCIPLESTENVTNRTETPEIEINQEETNCGVCLKTFESVNALADHIFIHTETELQTAFETSSKEKNLQQKSAPKTTKLSKSTCARTKGRENVVNQPPHSDDPPEDETNSLSGNVEESESKSTVDKEKSLPHTDCLRGSKSVSTSGKSRNRAKVKTKNSDSPRKAKSVKPRVASSKQSVPLESSNSAEPVLPNIQQTKIVSKKSPASASAVAEEVAMITDVTKPITVCQCHLTDVTYGSTLRIEVALLCHTCRVLYRSMECFETHYRFIDHIMCTKNRLHGRSAKLFCTNCGMIFSSLQDVRQHLEIHARFNNCVTTDFRCDLCKVIFIGIGSLFYVHWSNHQKNPFFLASRFTFPKSSIVTPRDTEGNSANICDYLYVAEHICLTCRVPFTTEKDLLEHKQNCQTASTTGPCISASIVNSNNEPRQRSKLKLICSMCNKTFVEASFLRQHIKKNHYHYEKPRYLRLFLSANKVAVVCGACGSIHETMIDFKTHWNTHNPNQEYFICTNCGERVQDFEAFMTHAMTHKSNTDEDLPQCKVSCFDTEFICKVCNLCFVNEEHLSKHIAYNKCYSEKDSATSIRLVDVISNIVTDNMQINQISDRNQVQPAVGVETLIVAKLQEANESNKSVGNEESNKSVNNATPEVETSDGELVIDLDSSEDEESRNEKRQQKTSVNVLSPTKTVKPLQPPIPTTEQATDQQVETQNATRAENTTKDKTTENVIKSIEPTSTSVATNKIFLRVKPLAELTAKKNYYQCTTCNIWFLSNAELESHFETHRTSSAGNIVSGSNIGTTNVPLLSGGAYNVSDGSTVSSAVRSTIKPLSDGPEQFSRKSPANRSYTAPIQFCEPQQTREHDQQATWHIREENQSAVQKQSYSERSAYHKNLPPCNIGRPPVAAALRLSARQNTVMGESSVRSSLSGASVSNSTTDTAIGAQQQQERSTVGSPQGLNTIFLFTPTQPINTNNIVKNPMSAIRMPEQQSHIVLPHLKQSTPNRFTCSLCPEFKCKNVVEYTKHELTALHKCRLNLRTRGLNPSPRNQSPGGVVNQGAYPSSTVKTTSNTTPPGFLYSMSHAADLSRTEDQPKLRVLLPKNSKQSHPQIQSQQQVQPQRQIQQQGQPQRQIQQQGQPQLQTQQQTQHQQQLGFQHQGQVYRLCQSTVCTDPIVYLTQPTTQQRVNYTVPNVVIDNTNLCENLTTLHPQGLSSVTATDNFYPTITIDDTLDMGVVHTNVNYTPSGSTYSCPHCSDISFPTESLLQSHVDIYHSYICEYCGLRLYKISDLNGHKQTHKMVWGNQCKSK